jgi:hypothetical protein
VGSGVQIHDFNAEILENGLFWTEAIPPGVEAAPNSGRAVMHVTGVDLEDYFNLANALQDGPSVPGEASVEVIWDDLIRRVELRDETNRFTGRFVENHARMAFTASTSEFVFESDPIGTSGSLFAEVGQERNGIFFPGPG